MASMVPPDEEGNREAGHVCIMIHLACMMALQIGCLGCFCMLIHFKCMMSPQIGCVAEFACLSPAQVLMTTCVANARMRTRRKT